MISALLSRCIMLVFGTLYPGYRSYKAVKNKDVREYVKWMMYWIVFSLFITGETFADVFLSWLPLYYEIKIIFIIWLLSPATKGSSILYRKFVHPRLVKHEQQIDKYIAHAQKRSYSTLMDVGRKGFNVATDTLLKTATTGQYQLIQTLKRYNSMQELRGPDSDTVDAGFGKRSTWYEGQADLQRGFNPENDVVTLERQYKSSRSSNSLTITEDNYELQRSQSDLNLSRSVGNDINEEDEEGTTHNLHTTSKAHAPSFEVESTVPVSKVDYNYAYSSNTLPRARKVKKPIHETLPVTKTRHRRTTDKKT